ncbi:MAG: hypothetical protein GY799_21265 [Desulfobulbaceae bacterium]|nr:hypothetical protein [Desulfobulbaceae bacterium]
MNKMTSKQKGDVTEVQCLLFLIKLGYNVSIPYGENCPYDLVVEINNKLYKIQCKTSRVIGDGSTICFKCCSTQKNTSRIRAKTYIGKIDYFMTYYNGTCYLVPISECGKSEKTLRFEPPKNRMLKGISFAKDYELETVISKI